MTSVLTDWVEQLSSAVVVASITDMPSLADLHTRLQTVQSLVAIQNGEGQTSSPATGNNDELLSTAQRAEKLVEQIILHDVEDLTSAFSEVSKLVEDIQCIVNGGKRSSGPSTSQAAAKPPAPPPTLDESIVTAEDAPVVLEFVGEAMTHMESAEASLLTLEENPDDLEQVNTIFRAFHTIKGVAGFLNLKQIQALAHAAENLLDLARKGKMKLQGNEMDLILRSLDLAKTMVQSIDKAAQSQTAPPPVPELADVLARFAAAVKSSGEGAPGRTGPAAHAAAPAPQSPASQSPAQAQTLASAQTSPASPGADNAPSPSRQNTASGAESAAEEEPEAKAASAAESAPAAKPSGAAAENQAATRPPQADATLKVATDRLDALINTVGELVIAQAMVAQDIGAASGNQRLARHTAQMGKITRSLQDLSMSMRMVPIQGVFQKMARLVRDVGRKACKEVEFSHTGGETELDRNVVEAISDPLVHMVRNAVDHGVESPEQRVAAGKPRAGKIELKACHQGGSVVIQITDDGKGLNKARIIEKAIAAGLVKEGQELPEADIFRLIFHPGLSTAEKVTDISGRGVGMDVVKKNVDALRGRVEISSTEGKGSVFTIRLPLTLAVIDGLIVKVGVQRYIIPITSIEKSIRPAAQQLSSVQERGELCMERERLLPVVRLHRLFKIDSAKEDPTHAIVVVVHDGESRACLLVDELVGQQQVVIKSLGEGIGKVSGISGCAILGDGNVSLILDVAGIIQSALA